MPPAKRKTGGSKKPPDSNVKTQTGGNGDDDNAVSPPGVEIETHDVPSSKTRVGLVTDDDFEFTPVSLVGSWFLKVENGEVDWRGVIVAQVQPDVYLVHIDRQEPRVLNVQRLVNVEHMTMKDEGYEWRFYDTLAEANEAFSTWELGERKEQG